MLQVFFFINNYFIINLVNIVNMTIRIKLNRTYFLSFNYFMQLSVEVILAQKNILQSFIDFLAFSDGHWNQYRNINRCSVYEPRFRSKEAYINAGLNHKSRPVLIYFSCNQTSRLNNFFKLVLFNISLWTLFGYVN